MTQKESIRFVSAAGSLGAGKIVASALEEAMKYKPHFIACDAGTTDSGASALGSGVTNYPREGIKRDLDIILPIARRAGIPVIVGSCGTAGADSHVDMFVEIANEIAEEYQFKIKVGIIHSEQSKEYLKNLLHEGRIRPLDPAPPIDDSVIDGASHIVGMMGVEPLQGAIAGGAEIVLAGRCSDAALFAAIPIMEGFPEGLAWHAGKLLECGTQACVTGNRGVLFAEMTHDDFIVRAFGDDLKLTPQSVAAHSFYENSDPYLHAESSGMLDLTDSVYTAVDDVTVRVSGSAFRHAEDYTVKLEGARLAGYQSVVIGGIRDPFFIRQLDSWLDKARKKIATSVSEILKLSEQEYTLVFHVYGVNGVMGEMEPVKTPAHEVGIVMEVTAQTQDVANKVALISRQPLLHLPIPEWSGAITSFAFLHNPCAIDRGAVYTFCLNHVALPHTKSEMFRTNYRTIG